MSARPDLVRLSGEDLDLLLSRSLDGDLSSEEERSLAEILASDPRAVRRREELAALVGKLNALPDPAPPLGLTARTNAWTAERGKGIGAVWHRLGLFPPPPMLRGIGALFVIVLIGMSVLRTQNVRQKAEEPGAEKNDGRVAIFFGERGASSPSAQKPSAPRAPAREAVAAAPSVNAPLQKSRIAAAEKSAEKKDAVMDELPFRPQPPKAEIARSEPFSARRDAASGAKTAGAVAGAAAPAAHSESVLSSARDEMAPSGAAPVLRAARAPLAWDVTVANAFVRGWSLRRVAAPPPPASTPTVSYRVTLDTEGKVVSARALDATTPEMDTAVRSLVFQKLTADAPSEIEIALAAR